MKYLQPSFTVYPVVRDAAKRVLRDAKIIPVDPKHRYTECGGMCYHCALDKKGHIAKGYGK